VRTARSDARFIHDQTQDVPQHGVVAFGLGIDDALVQVHAGQRVIELTRLHWIAAALGERTVLVLEVLHLQLQLARFSLHGFHEVRTNVLHGGNTAGELAHPILNVGHGRPQLHPQGFIGVHPHCGVERFVAPRLAAQALHLPQDGLIGQGHTDAGRIAVPVAALCGRTHVLVVGVALRVCRMNVGLVAANGADQEAVQ
jgi:hypothetical protein